nr:hypothetical protein [Nocardia veterana]
MLDENRADRIVQRARVGMCRAGEMSCRDAILAGVGQTRGVAVVADDHRDLEARARFEGGPVERAEIRAVV